MGDLRGCGLKHDGGGGAQDKQTLFECTASAAYGTFRVYTQKPFKFHDDIYENATLKGASAM